VRRQFKFVRYEYARRSHDEIIKGGHISFYSGRSNFSNSTNVTRKTRKYIASSYARVYRWQTEIDNNALLLLPANGREAHMAEELVSH
jgi:hypothetical protein